MPGNAEGTADSVVVDFIEVDYRRQFLAVGGALEFVYPDGEVRFQVAGFTDAALTAYDLSERDPVTEPWPRRLRAS